MKYKGAKKGGKNRRLARFLKNCPQELPGSFSISIQLFVGQSECGSGIASSPPMFRRSQNYISHTAMKIDIWSKWDMRNRMNNEKYRRFGAKPNKTIEKIWAITLQVWFGTGFQNYFRHSYSYQKRLTRDE